MFLSHAQNSRQSISILFPPICMTNLDPFCASHCTTYRCCCKRLLNLTNCSRQVTNLKAHVLGNSSKVLAFFRTSWFVSFIAITKICRNKCCHALLHVCSGSGSLKISQRGLKLLPRFLFCNICSDLCPVFQFLLRKLLFVFFNSVCLFKSV